MGNGTGKGWQGILTAAKSNVLLLGMTALGIQPASCTVCPNSRPSVIARSTRAWS